MPPRNFPNDNISHPYPNDYEFDEEDIVDHKLQKVGSTGYVEVEGWPWHFVAWVPLEVHGVVRNTTRQLRPDRMVPSYVQSEQGVNIGPSDDWSGRYVAVFVLDEQLSDEQRAAVSD